MRAVRAARARSDGCGREGRARAATAPARCWCGSRPPASATPTCTWPTARSATGAGRWCSATRERASSRRSGRASRASRRRPRRALLRARPAASAARAARAAARCASRLARRSVAGTLLDGTSRLRGADGSAAPARADVACFAETRSCPAAARPDPGRRAAVAGGAARLRRRHRRRRRLPCAPACGIGDRVCVIGCGGVGLQVIAGAGWPARRTIVAVDRRAETSSSTRCAAAPRTRSTRPPPTPAPRPCASPAAASTTRSRWSARAETIRLAWDVLRPGRDGGRGRGLAPAASRSRCRRSIPVARRRSSAATTARRDPRATFPAGRAGPLGRLELGRLVSHLIELDGVEGVRAAARGEGDAPVSSSTWTGARGVTYASTTSTDGSARAGAARAERQPRQRRAGAARHADRGRAAGTFTSPAPGHTPMLVVRRRGPGSTTSRSGRRRS